MCACARAGNRRLRGGCGRDRRVGYRADRSIVDRLRILSRGSLPWKSIDAEKAIPWVEART
jgi:hypothetical protein